MATFLLQACAAVQWAAEIAADAHAFQQPAQLCSGQQHMPLQSIASPTLCNIFHLEISWRNCALSLRLPCHLAAQACPDKDAPVSCTGMYRCKGTSKLCRHVQMQGHRAEHDGSCRVKPRSASQCMQLHTLWLLYGLPAQNTGALLDPLPGSYGRKKQAKSSRPW